MYKDINGKTGFTGLIGNSGKTYNHVKLLSKEEREDMLADGISEYIPPAKPQPTVEQQLERAKEAKKCSIREGLALHLERPIVDGNGVGWNGGFESAIKLDAAKRLAEESGLTEVIFFDVHNQPYTLPILDATAVVTLVAGDYQSAFGIKQASLVAIDNAVTLEEIELVVNPWQHLFEEDL